MAFQSFLIVFGILGVVGSTLVAFWVGLQSAFNPLNYSPYDAIWFWVYAVAFGLTAIVAGIGRGRLLLVVTLVMSMLLFLLVIIGGGTGFAFLLLGWLLLAAGALGERFVRLAAPSLSASFLELVLVWTSCGLGLLALLMLILGLLNLFYPVVAYATLAVITLAFLAPSFRSIRPVLVKGLAQASRVWESADLRLTSIVVSSGVICLWGALVWAVVPSIHFDALVYHLGVPAVYVQMHGLVEVTEEFRSYWAHNGEMLYTLGLLLIDQPLPTLIHLASGVLVAGWIFALGKRIGGARLGMLSTIIFYSIPLVTFESGTAYVDLFVTLFTFGALASAMVWWMDSNDAWLVISGTLAGFSVGTKISSMYVLAPLGLLIVGGLLSRHRIRKPFFLSLLRFGAPALLLGAPWLVRDWAWTGNPIFPFFNSFFTSPKWLSENTFFNFGTFGMGHAGTDFLRLPWDFVTQGESFLETGMGMMGGLGMLALPWCLPASSRSIRKWILILSALSLVSLVVWFQISQYARYLLPLFPVLALLAAINLESIWAWLSTRSWRLPATVLLFILGLAYLVSTRWGLTRTYWIIPDRYPFRVALGWSNPSNFLSGAVSVYDAFQFLNSKDRPQVLSIGNDFRLYTNARIVPIDSEPKTRFPMYISGPRLVDEIKDRGFDLVLINRDNIRGHPERYASVNVVDPLFLSKYAHLEFSRHNVDVYSLRPVDIDAPNANLLANEGFEDLDSKGNPVGWFGHENPVVDSTGTHSHSGKVAVEIRGASNLYQRIAVSSGRNYTLGHWTRADSPNQFARLQINWLDSNLQIVDVSIDLATAGSDWQWHQMSVTAPQGASLAQVYASVHENSEVWFDDFSFVELR